MDLPLIQAHAIRMLSWDALGPLSNLQELQELSLDGNPLLATTSFESYLERILAMCPSNIRVLDGQMVGLCMVDLPQSGWQHWNMRCGLMTLVAMTFGS